MPKKNSLQTVAVISATGKPLMPTNSCRARQLLKKGKAVIHKYRPFFTIQLTEREDGEVQELEAKMDTGYRHIGLSVCSEKHEYISRQYDLLSDETEHHNDCHKYRRTRRNRLRYRKPRFGNRKGLISKDGFAPSIRNKRDRHVDIMKAACEVFPITRAYVEMGEFDTQVLKAVAAGKPLPEGTDYQHGDQYGYYTLRQAVFARDDYRCQICGRSGVKDGAILHEHHIGFWKGDRTNRMSNLLTVCEHCHTAKNHKKGGALYGLEPKLNTLKAAAFMNSVRYSMYRMMQDTCPDVEFHMTYGAATKAARHELGIPKSHAGDAYCMGTFHPEHRAHTERYQKHRRNNRVLEYFYDATYIDIRDGSKKKGSQLSCGRTRRNIPRNNPQNERMYRGKKLSGGRRSVRRKHYSLRSGDVVKFGGKQYVVKGMQNNGAYVAVKGRTPIAVKKVSIIHRTGGWQFIPSL